MENTALKHRIPGFELMARYLERTRSYSDLRLVVELTLVSFAMKIAVLVPAVLIIIIGSMFVDIPTDFLSSEKTSWDMSIGLLIFATLIAPPIETLFCQLLPIEIVQYFTSRLAWPIIISSILFGLLHGGYAQKFSSFSIGLVLAWVYVIKRTEPGGKAFWLTVVVHALHNFIAFSLKAFIQAIDA